VLCVKKALNPSERYACLLEVMEADRQLAEKLEAADREIHATVVELGVALQQLFDVIERVLDGRSVSH